jgi:hypothetical protein
MELPRAGTSFPQWRHTLASGLILSAQWGHFFPPGATMTQRKATKGLSKSAIKKKPMPDLPLASARTATRTLSTSQATTQETNGAPPFELRVVCCPQSRLLFGACQGASARVSTVSAQIRVTVQPITASGVSLMAGGKLGAQFGAHLDQNWSQLVAEPVSAPLPASPHK